MKATRQILYIAPVLALVFALSGLLGSVRIAAAQGTSNDATIQTFIDAYNNGDISKAQPLVVRTSPSYRTNVTLLPRPLPSLSFSRRLSPTSCLPTSET
jgi:hypothetical protein